MKLHGATREHHAQLPACSAAATTVLVAIESARVREALIAMLGALEAFRVVAEADTDEAALEAARNHHPQLALIEPELSSCGGWWVIKELLAEHLAGVVVALGRRTDGVLAQMIGAHAYVQMGTSPRDLLDALEAALSIRATATSTAEAEGELLADAYAVL